MVQAADGSRWSIAEARCTLVLKRKAKRPIVEHVRGYLEQPALITAADLATCRLPVITRSKAADARTLQPWQSNAGSSLPGREAPVT